MKALALIALAVCLCGCSTRRMEDPTERGLTCLANAVIIAAFVRAVFNK